jgi:ABC-2 type transport system ATP-binding protein
MTGLADAAQRKIGGYSGGMVQRLGIAQAIYHRPKVVFLDEPVSALDPIGRREVLDFIRMLKDQATVCMSTHILDDVERVCTDVAIIRNGEIVLTADTGELLKTYSPEFYLLTFETESEAGAAEQICRNIGAECISMTEKESSVYSRNTIRLSLEGYREHRSRILAGIASGNLRLNDISRESARLEDIFIEIIQKGGQQ